MAPNQLLQCSPEELVERYRQGDVKACEQLLLDPAHRLRIEKIARKNTTGSFVCWEEAAQEAHLKLLQCVRNKKFCKGGVEDFYRWAGEVAKNAIIDILRMEKRKRGVWGCESLDQPLPGQDITLGEILADDFDSWDALERTDLVLKVREAIKTIDQSYPKKGYYKLWVGLVQEKDLSQIAAELGVKQPEISKRRKELLLRLAEKLELLTAEQIKQNLLAIRQGRGKGRKRSDTQW